MSDIKEVIAQTKAPFHRVGLVRASAPAAAATLRADAGADDRVIPSFRPLP